MRSIFEACEPRAEILAGTFNPEVFTASLTPVIESYRGGRQSPDTVYADAEIFFRDLTFATQGLRTTLAEVLGRIAGDLTVPAIHRLETAFGGGKTHSLLACTHVARRGTELAGVTAGLIDAGLLPRPGSVVVVGVAGDEIPVHKPKGDALTPYTLWGEIAYQVGGEALYREVEDEAGSYAAPGKPFFEKVLGERKALIMLDELAQYAARLEAAKPDGASQLAAFLLSLHGYARTRPGISVVLTLASAADAFARQTEVLARLVSQVKGADVTGDDAVNIGERALKGVSSVVARDAVQIVPVQAGEISPVLAKRLLSFVDRETARRTAEAYMNMYRRNAGSLPEEASSEDYKGRLVGNYPFHPTLVDFLNRKLAQAENFQGTRGVLRVLALALRSLWQGKKPIPMIHACHLDLRSERVAGEILGRTGSSDLLLVLNADVGSVGTGTLEGGHSNAELADRRNPHPEGYPFHEYTWKTVFLHSLVGRAQGLGSKIFGITEPEVLLSVAFPGLTPPQVRTALAEINESAYYLRHEEGKYFAGEEPTINNVLAKIRKTLEGNEIKDLLDSTARKIINGGNGFFHVEHDVSLPEHLPDGQARPILGVVSLTAGKIDIEAFVTTKGVNKAREHQNLIFVLVPETVTALDNERQEELMTMRAGEAWQRIEGIARQVKAMSKLVEKPQNYGVSVRRLEEDDFRKRFAERRQALVTAVGSIYTGLYHPSTSGHIVRHEVKTAGGEGGASFLETIRELLIANRELLTGRNTTQSDLADLGKLFFAQADTVSQSTVRRNFLCVRSWPVLENDGVLEQIVRAGVTKGAWCVYRMGTGASGKPEEIYYTDNEIPMAVNWSGKDYALVTIPGAKQRGWTGTRHIDPAQVRDAVTYVLGQSGSATVDTLAEQVAGYYGEVPAPALDEAVAAMVRKGRVMVYHGSPDQTEKPDLIFGPSAVLYTPQKGDILVTPGQASERGWVSAQSRTFHLGGTEGTAKVLPLLRRLGAIYNRGAKCTIDTMDLVDLELPRGGTLRLQLNGATPESLRTLGELFEVLDGVVKKGEYTEAFLEITEPDDDCPFIRELRKPE
ncbi:MAG: DUF499 domain-containing protein [Peptococcaceae bacterium]|nr:DUF499 domain-containing protein [Peptococcaceae bacterium]